MKLAHYLNRPEYLFRPGQLYRRLDWRRRTDAEEFKDVLLPWQLKIRIPTNPDDKVGRSIETYGIYDLSLTEALWRLVGSGEIAVDVGANIGYMTSIMAQQVGHAGQVWCFEPNPEVYAELIANIDKWQEANCCKHIYPHQIALSDRATTGVLQLPNKNRGEAFLASTHNPQDQQENERHSKAFTVAVKRLDAILEEKKNIGVLKIDVEGHELGVLKGALDLINRNAIRDILFEDHRGYPNQVSEFLETRGYKVFRIWKGLWRPILELPHKNLIHPWEPPNYLATKNPERASDLMQPRGWYSLTGRLI